MSINIEFTSSDQSKHVEKILRSLPEWFGIEESLIKYVEASKEKPLFIAKHKENIVGFLMLERHFKESAEVFCMGVLPSYHRQGIGRSIQHSCEKYLKKDGAITIQVKTISPEKKDPYYLKTLKFYKAMGFTPVEIFSNLWQAWNPCMLLIKNLK